MDKEGVRALLRKRAAKFAKNRGSSGMFGWAEHHGIPRSHVSEFMRGLRNPTTSILDALGLERSYSRKPKDDTHG